MAPRIAAAAVAVAGLAACGSSSGGPAGGGQPTVPACPASPFPPSSFNDLRCMSVNALEQPQVLSNERIGIVPCGGRKEVILIPKGYTARQSAGVLAEAYFSDVAGVPFESGQPVGDGVVFGVHARTDLAKGDGYTAGRLQYDAPCSGAQPPDMELDVGDVLNGKQYPITSGVK